MSISVGSVDSAFGRLRPGTVQIANEVLEERPHILSPVNQQFVAASRIILTLYNHFHQHNRDAIPPGHELPLHSTGLVYMGLLTSLKKYKRLWPQIPVDDENLQGNPHFGFFCLVLNKYKTSNGKEFELKTREGEMDGYPIAYATHTHADLPNFMNSYSLGSSHKTFSLAGGHDLEEEGLRFIPGVESHEIDAKYLVDRFTEDNLGIFLAIGIPTLTESKYEVMKKGKTGIDRETLRHYEASEPVTRLLAESISKLPPAFKSQIDILILHSPLEYGGLALQIRRVVEILLNEAKANPQSETTLSNEEMRLLAKSLIEVELADRMSDISELEWFVVTKHSDAPHFGRYKTIFKACRMLNMFEKLLDAIELGGWQNDFQNATDGFTAILEAKIIEINEHLRTKGQNTIDDKELLQFYYEKFRPVQQEADLAMAGFIENKVKRMLIPLYMHCQ